MMSQNNADKMISIPLSLIFKGDNPRKHFDAAELEELTASVLAKGVLQPIVVMPINEGDGYKIIAGERRFRAAVAAYGIDGYDIPAVVKNVSEEEAEELALIENIQRADMSVTEEAVASGKILKRYKDKAEASAALGWPLSKFNRRLALLNLIPEAMDALDERRIQIGHAELMSAVPQDRQAKALQTITDHKLTVSQVKDLLVKVSTDFTTAIFDLQGCQNCHHNSSQQASLFVDSIGEGSCTNKDCFEGKSTEMIEAIRVELAEEVQTVKIINIGENGFTKLSVSGNLGVGQEQYDQCKACANFGATVSNLPSERGIVERSICFDTTCAQKKAAERIRAEKKTAEAKAAPAVELKPNAGTEPEAGSTDATGTAKEAVPATKTKPAKAKVAELSQKIVEYRRKEVWEKAVKKELAANPEKSRAFVIDLLLTGDSKLVDREKLAAIYGKVTGGAYPDTDRFSNKKTGHPELAYNLTVEQQDKMFCGAAIAAVHGIEETRLQKLLIFLDTDLTRYFTLGVELLSLLTKSEIEAVCVDLGLDGVVAGYKKVVGGKKDEAIKAILDAPFDFTGAVPSILNY